jgi:hypothetical protein
MRFASNKHPLAANCQDQELVKRSGVAESEGAVDVGYLFEIWVEIGAVFKMGISRTGFLGKWQDTIAV